MTDDTFPTANYQGERPEHPALEVIDLKQEAGGVHDAYSNLLIGTVNSHCLRLAVFEGDYPWHHHPASDELFLVVEGALLIDLTDGRTLRLEPWQAASVPAGTVHRTRTVGRTVNLCFEELATETVFVDGPRGK